MKVVAAASTASLDGYAEADWPTPIPGHGQVRIRVAAVGIGYVDALVALGRYQVKPQMPHVPGAEISGVIDAVGPDTGDWAPGDRVFATAVHGLAQQALAPASSCRPLPATTSFAAGAAFPLNYLTMLHGLADRGRLRPGETVLVFGAAGGVGSAAIDIGKAMGARVIGAASTPEKRDFARARGADAVVDTAVEGWRDRLKSILADTPLDVIVDPLCGPLFEPAFRSLGWGGRHLVIGFVGGPIPALPSNLTLMKGAALIGVDIRQFQLFEPQAAARHLDTLASWLADGRVAPAVGAVFEWHDFGLALQSGLAGQTLGKTVVTVAQ